MNALAAFNIPVGSKFAASPTIVLAHVIASVEEEISAFLSLLSAFLALYQL